MTTDVLSQVLLARIKEEYPGRHRPKTALWCRALRHRNLQARRHEVNRTMREKSERKSRAYLHAALQPVKLGPGEATKELLYTARVQCNIEHNFLILSAFMSSSEAGLVACGAANQGNTMTHIYAHPPALPRSCGGAAPAASAVPSASLQHTKLISKECMGAASR